MNQIAVSGISGLLSGALYGAIGAGVGQASSGAPVLKGAAVSGLIGGVLATAVGAVIAQRQAESQLEAPQSAYSSEVFFP